MRSASPACRSRSSSTTPGWSSASTSARCPSMTSKRRSTRWSESRTGDPEHRHGRADGGDHGDDGAAARTPRSSQNGASVGMIARNAPSTAHEHPQRQLDRAEQHEGERHQPLAEDEGERRRTRRRRPGAATTPTAGRSRQATSAYCHQPIAGRRRGDGEQRPGEPAAQERASAARAPARRRRRRRAGRVTVRAASPSRTATSTGDPVDPQRDGRRLDLRRPARRAPADPRSSSGRGGRARRSGRRSRPAASRGQRRIGAGREPSPP